MPAPSHSDPSVALADPAPASALPEARPDVLPLDGDSILALAAQSMFHLFSSISQGMFLVDRSGCIVWVNEGYRRFLPALGFSSIDQFLGHRVEDVIHNTQMRRVLETGEPILIDLLTNKAGTFVVSRLPLRDDAGGVIGAIGIVLFDHPETTLKPLISKFARLQQDLDDARRELAVQRKRQLSAPDGERRAKYTFASFVGTSAAAVEVKRQARRAAQSASRVLLLGETGTGKELLAHAVHAASSRASGPFVSVNIAAVPDTLLEAEFFGVAPGAYTGADRKGRDGKFRLADGGTLFLDEIGDMPLNLQAKLLRALQEGEIEPLGSNRLLPFDARVIAATSRDLLAPVRERASDIVALVEVLGEDMALRNGSPPPELTPQALALLQAQPWRGNIRELRNVLEQAALRSEGGPLDLELLSRVLQDSGLTPVRPTAASLSPVSSASPSLPAPGAAASLAVGQGAQAAGLRPLAELERQAIAQALQATGGNKVAAARLLGISRATLYERLG